VSRDAEEYMQVVFANSRCLLIIDEAGEAIGAARSSAERGRIALATRTRHRGHSAIFIAQRVTLLAPSIRTQCERAWVFRQHADELRALARDLTNDAVLQAGALPKGKCIYLTIYGEAKEVDVFSLDNEGKSVRRVETGGTIIPLETGPQPPQMNGSERLH
jgi:hypothetical protein